MWGLGFSQICICGLVSVLLTEPPLGIRFLQRRSQLFGAMGQSPLSRFPRSVPAVHWLLVKAEPQAMQHQTSTLKPKPKPDLEATSH